ncbi:PD-(D/E)XK nuclease family protein [Acrocarpospora sp. B8E8]|uniref:RecB family exonuclease n=1 Tax=Acrocarpospora sp. B8E8 TaxID=3153572 RepID=UPI00325F18B3
MGQPAPVPVHHPAAPDDAHRSVSQYQSYTDCPAAYFLARRARVPQAPAAWFIHGSAVHEAVEKWERSRRNASLEAVYDWFDESWTREYQNAADIEPDFGRWVHLGRSTVERDLEARYQRALDQLTDYIHVSLSDPYQPLVLDGQVAVEWEFTLPLRGGVVVKGFIDLLLEGPAGDILVQDLKTGSRKPASTLQLGVYKLAVEQATGLSVEYGRYFMAKDGQPGPPVHLGGYDFDRVSDWFAMMNRGVRIKVFPPRPGEHCRICTVSRFCPVNGPDRLPAA